MQALCGICVEYHKHRARLATCCRHVECYAQFRFYAMGSLAFMLTYSLYYQVPLAFLSRQPPGRPGQPQLAVPLLQAPTCPSAAVPSQAPTPHQFAAWGFRHKSAQTPLGCPRWQHGWGGQRQASLQPQWGIFSS